MTVFTEAVTNAGVLGTALISDPLPVARQAAQNWIGYGQATATALSGVAQAGFDYLTTTTPQALQAAAQQIRDGNLIAASQIITDLVVGAVINIGYPAFDLVTIPGQITDNLSAAVKSVTDISTLLNLVIGVIGPVSGVILAVGDTSQQFIDALGVQDYSAAAQAVFDFAPRLVTAVINGYTTLDGNGYPGLLSPPDAGGQNGGLAYSLLVTIPRAIATAIGAPVPTAPARVAKPATSIEAAGATDVTDSTDGTSSSTTGASQANGKSSAKKSPGAKRSPGAKKATGGKSARPHAGAKRGGGSAAE
ncbi:hypothetical protein [Mycobacterium sp. RTGN5]|uniref:hypothetical protein n=1 Tax=Mycobacterium sp. RTGN5 TaxID=3016522 RepID=UPI0029C65234|nr:hypothetical protein [Mycobacterium sp. RTGN5]